MLMVRASNFATILNAPLKHSKSGSKRHSIGEIATPRVSVAAGSRCRSFDGSMKVRSQVGVLSLEFPECGGGRRVGDRVSISVVAAGRVRAVRLFSAASRSAIIATGGRRIARCAAPSGIDDATPDAARGAGRLVSQAAAAARCRLCRKPARCHPGLCRGSFDGGHQDQHADHGDAASDFGHRT